MASLAVWLPMTVWACDPWAPDHVLALVLLGAAMCLAVVEQGHAVGIAPAGVDRVVCVACVATWAACALQAGWSVALQWVDSDSFVQVLALYANLGWGFAHGVGCSRDGRYWPLTVGPWVAAVANLAPGLLGAQWCALAWVVAALVPRHPLWTLCVPNALFLWWGPPTAPGTAGPVWDLCLLLAAGVGIVAGLVFGFVSLRGTSATP